MENGNIVVTYPFLEKSTEAELAFCRLLAVEKPFIAPHGSKTAAWKVFITQLNEQRADDNKLLYDPPMTERYARDRVTEYFSFVKKKIAATPFNSGCDDEDEPCELLQMVEDLYEQNESFESEAKKKKNLVERNKLESEALRTGSLAHFTSKTAPNNEVADEDFIVEATPKPTKQKKYGNATGSSDSSYSGTDTAVGKHQSSIASKSSRGSTMEGSVNSFGAMSKRHLEIAAEKEMNKKLKYEVKLKLIEEKKSKREEKAKAKAIQQEEERKNKEYERERNDKMLAALLSLHKKNTE